MTIPISAWEMSRVLIFCHFDSQKEDNYLMDTLWPYLLGLYEAPSCVKHVGFNPHEQQ